MVCDKECDEERKRKVGRREERTGIVVRYKV
jgi:hypothetical protein